MVLINFSSQWAREYGIQRQSRAQDVIVQQQEEGLKLKETLDITQSRAKRQKEKQAAARSEKKRKASVEAEGVNKGIIAAKKLMLERAVLEMDEESPPLHLQPRHQHLSYQLG